jgi:glyoxylase-like metal-dependent hydrolase (beta-lactamase superfamily II)
MKFGAGFILCGATILMPVGRVALAQGQDFSAVEVQVHDVAGSVHYLEGAGGNVGVLVGDDGVLMIDDQFAPLSEKLVAAIRTLSDGPIQFLINTHIHGDHNGRLDIGARQRAGAHDQHRAAAPARRMADHDLCGWDITVFQW